MQRNQLLTEGIDKKMQWRRCLVFIVPLAAICLLLDVACIGAGQYSQYAGKYCRKKDGDCIELKANGKYIHPGSPDGKFEIKEGRLALEPDTDMGRYAGFRITYYVEGNGLRPTDEPKPENSNRSYEYFFGDPNDEIYYKQ